MPPRKTPAKTKTPIKKETPMPEVEEVKTPAETEQVQPDVVPEQPADAVETEQVKPDVTIEPEPEINPLVLTDAQDDAVVEQDSFALATQDLDDFETVALLAFKQFGEMDQRSGAEKPALCHNAMFHYFKGLFTTKHPEAVFIRRWKALMAIMGSHDVYTNTQCILIGVTESTVKRSGKGTQYASLLQALGIISNNLRDGFNRDSISFDTVLGNFIGDASQTERVLNTLNNLYQ